MTAQTGYDMGNLDVIEKLEKTCPAVRAVRDALVTAYERKLDRKQDEIDDLANELEDLTRTLRREEDERAEEAAWQERQKELKSM